MVRVVSPDRLTCQMTTFGAVAMRSHNQAPSGAAPANRDGAVSHAGVVYRHIVCGRATHASPSLGVKPRAVPRALHGAVAADQSRRKWHGVMRALVGQHSDDAAALNNDDAVTVSEFHAQQSMRRNSTNRHLVRRVAAGAAAATYQQAPLA